MNYFILAIVFAIIGYTASIYTWPMLRSIAANVIAKTKAVFNVFNL